VILVDANLLVYAHAVDMPQHGAARQWLDERLSGTARVGLPWPSLTAFMRLITNPRVFPRPASAADAFAVVRAWLGAPAAWVPQPTDRHADVLGTLLAPDVRGDLIPDAHLAALAIEHGLLLASCDGDFGRFPGLRWENPLI
jgi:uncharacterized protein